MGSSELLPDDHLHIPHLLHIYNALESRNLFPIIPKPEKLDEHSDVAQCSAGLHQEAA